MKVKHIRKRIAILGENPDNDSDVFRLLLEQRPYPNIQFVVPIRNIKGGQMDVPLAVARHIKTAWLKKDSFERIIIIRDLDDVLNNTDEVYKKDAWFSTLNKAIDKIGIFYLVVAETEALFLADIDMINVYYGLKIKPYGDPKDIKDPKSELKSLSSKTNKPYEPNFAYNLMEKINFNSVYINHIGERSFKEFIDNLDTILFKNKKGKEHK